MILLDTCAVVWDALDQARLTEQARSAIAQADEHNALIVSDISLWEIAMLIKRSRVEVATNAANFINLYLGARNVSVIAISPEIAELSTGVDLDINDPADRIIAATAIIHNARLVTADAGLRQSALVDAIW